MPNWNIARQKYGRIRRGQLWKKIDNGMIMRICRKNDGGWSVVYINKGKGHHMLERTIYHFFELL